MTVEEKADALVEMGLVRMTGFDTSYRVITAEVAARNLDTAVVEFDRVKGAVLVVRCDHRTKEGQTHVCEGHRAGHVCYHARAALKFAARAAGKDLVFYKSAADAEGKTPTSRVMVLGHDAKAVFGQLS